MRNRETIRLDEATRNLLRCRAEQKNLTLSEYVRQLIAWGLENEQELTSQTYTKLEKILLKNSIENIMLLKYLVAQQNPSYVEEANQKSTLFLKQFLMNPNQ